MRGLYVDGEAVEPQPEGLADPEGWRVQVEDEAISSGYDPTCRHCGETVVEDDDYPEGWKHAEDDPADLSSTCSECGEGVHYDPEMSSWQHDELTECEEPAPGDDWHDPEPEPGGWWNSAHIAYDPNDDAVRVGISVGDPRGSFVFEVRRMPTTAYDEAMRGRLLIHTPYPGEGFAHEETHELRPGTLLVGPLGGIERELRITLNPTEAALILAQRMEDAPGWSSLARKGGRRGARASRARRARPVGRHLDHDRHQPRPVPP